MKFTYFMQLVFQQLGKKKLTYILLVLQIAVSAGLLIVIMTAIKYFGYNYFLFGDFKEKDAIFASFGGDLSVEAGEVSQEYINELELLKQIDGITVEQIYKGYNLKNEKSKSSQNISSYIYQDKTSAAMKLNLKEGEQLCDADIRDGAYPVIVPEGSVYAEKYKSGETFELFIPADINGDNTSSNEEMQPLSFYVCGVLKYPYRIYYNNYVDVPMIIEDVIISQYDVNFMLIRDMKTEDGTAISDKIDFCMPSAFIIYFDDSATAGEREAAISIIESKCNTVSYKKLLSLGYINYSEGMGDYTVAMIVLALLSIVGISGINLFLAESLKQEYALYFMCGAKWSTCIKIDALKSLFIVLFPAVFGAAVGCFIMLSDTWTKYFIDINTAIYTVLFIAMIYLASSLYFLIKLKKTRPIDNIRLMEKE